MDREVALGLAVIPPAVAVFFEAIHPIHHRYLESNSKQDLAKFEPDLATNYSILIQEVTKSTSAAVELGMLALTLVSVISGGFAILQEFDKPLLPAIIYVLFFVFITLYLLNLLAGSSLLEMDTAEAMTLRGRSITTSTILKFTIYFLNGALIIFAVAVLGTPENWGEAI